jgi:hypothetical protein
MNHEDDLGTRRKSDSRAEVLILLTSNRTPSTIPQPTHPPSLQLRFTG